MADSTVKVNFVGDESDLKRAAKGANDALDGVESKTKSSMSGIATGLAAVGGVAAITSGLMSASRAAAEDEAAQVSLAKTLQNVTGATKEQVAGVEAFISKTQNATGVLDDELRPAFDNLVRGTGDVAKSQQLMGLAMDISAGTGKGLTDVTDALSKAANGNFKALKSLDPALAGLIKDGASADEVFGALGQTFEGQTAAKASTTAGQMAILKARMADLQEEIGARVNVALLAMAGFIQDKLIPAVSSIVDWMKAHKEIVLGVGIAIGVVLVAAFLSWAAAAAAAAAATLLAMAPVIAITAAIALLVAGVIYAYTHWEWFRTTVDAVASFITGTLIPAFQGIWSFINDKIIPVIVTLIGWFVSWHMKVAEVIISISQTIGGFVDWLVGLPARIASIAGEMWEGLKNGLAAVVQWILDKLDEVVGPLDSILDKIAKVTGISGGTALKDALAAQGAQSAAASGYGAQLVVPVQIDGKTVTTAQIDVERKYN